MEVIVDVLVESEILRGRYAYKWFEGRAVVVVRPHSLSLSPLRSRNR